MAINLNGKVCLITGADKGIGRSLVEGFIKRGAQIAAGMLSSDHLSTLPSEVLSVKMDVTNSDQVATAISQVISRFGRIDVLINNAGIYPRKSAASITLADWRNVLDTNLDGTWCCSQAVIPHFIKNGRGVIINVGSIALRLGMPNLSHYLASKGGVVGLTRGMARDLGKYEIRVNCIHLGAVVTPSELLMFPEQESVLMEMNVIQSLPGRLSPESVEPVFAFLSSDESGDITGQCLTVDRGWSHD